MKVQQLLAHHGIRENPFSQEDAQSDQIFKRHCLDGTYHPAWDKIFGSPEDPSTAVVFGEKGSGKTALRLQIVGQIGATTTNIPTSVCWLSNTMISIRFSTVFATASSAASGARNGRSNRGGCGTISMPS